MLLFCSWEASLTEDDKPKLGNLTTDYVAAAVRAGTGLIPVGGSALNELIAHFIPNQRADRIEAYLRYLEAKLSKLDDDEVRSRTHTPEAAEIIEEGGYQAARALSDQRREQLAQLVAHGLTGDEADRIEAKRLLNLLRELDDAQIIILCSYIRAYNDDNDFHKRHEEVLIGPRAYMGSDRAEIDKATIHSLARDQLVNLGLLQATYKSIKKNELPEFDKRTGMMKSQGHQITPLGRILIRRIGLADTDDF